MKYDVTIDPDDTATSHGLVVDLVGTGKTVLDVGCSTGYLAEALTQRGNRVSGVEIDAKAGELARPRVERLVIGDLETLDLVEEFGERSFDVVIFADVLEHLRNPLGVLRSARSLLTKDGSVVISIPNVAHGAVRLALLQGRFEYRDLGLLDDTHLRFFTRSTLDDLLREAGFFPVDMRRTRSGPFETEIPVAASDFDPGVVDRLSHDRESTTYQFVVRAVPVDTTAGDEALVERVFAQEREIGQLEEQLQAIVRHLAATPHAPVIGVVTAQGRTPIEKLRISTIKAELIRRLDAYVVRLYSMSDTPQEVGLTGETAFPLLPWTAEHRQQIRGEVDTVVVVGVVGQQLIPELRVVVDDLETAGCALHLIAVDLPPDSDQARPWGMARHARRTAVAKDQTATAEDAQPTVIPDPIFLATRLFPLPFLRQRRHYLQLVGQLPLFERLLVAYLPGIEPTEADVAWKALATVSRRLGAAIVVLTDGPGGPFDEAITLVKESDEGPCVVRDASPIDLLAILEAATLVVTDSPGALMLSVGLERPVVGLTSVGATESSEFVEWGMKQHLRFSDVHSLVSVAEVAAGNDESRLAGLASSLEGFLDELTEAIVWRSGSRLLQTVPQRLAELQDQVNVLEAANAGFRQVLARERHAMAARAEDVLRGGEDPLVLEREAAAPTLAIERTERRRAREELERATQESSRLQFELDAVYATRTMRAVRPARRVYAKLRAITR